MMDWSAAPVALVDLVPVQLHLLRHFRVGLVHLHVGPDLLAHGEECVFDVAALFGTGLEELDSQRVGQFLALLVGDLSLALEVTLVAHH